jgi:hypothetical protein
MEIALMDSNDDVSTDENGLTCDVSDDALEHAAGCADGQAWTLNFCTYDYSQCGPIGSRL